VEKNEGCDKKKWRREKKDKDEIILGGFKEV
jgi:hypothetical protein